MITKETRQYQQEVNPNLVIDDIISLVCRPWSKPTIAAEAARFLGVDSYKVTQEWSEKRYIPDEFRGKILECASLTGVALTLYERYYLNTGTNDLAESASAEFLAPEHCTAV